MDWSEAENATATPSETAACNKRLGIDPVIHLNNLGRIKKGRMLADFAVRAYELKVAAIVSPVMA